ncbi:RHS repeat-associated core domain-containing protein [Vibrio sp. ZSDZ34]|uniref:RHS repeat-associated core domain-containing protein n=1 Tax=Vibrio gelatinilyticus TaxID=2893468 RepID=A0A9X1WCH4_9VIBR|nr:RHS repeat-associated core domain-containing protein [Vibrio gelatinilyticus]
MCLYFFYTPFGEVYRKDNDKAFWKKNDTVNANHQLNQLMPYQYTGKFTESNTGLVQMDARWYNPHTHRFQHPDYWNLKNTYLPAEIQNELMRFTGLNTAQLLNDPSQQLAYGYVSGNPLRYIDPWGLCMTEGAFSSSSSQPEGEIQYTEQQIADSLDGVGSRAHMTYGERLEDGYQNEIRPVINTASKGAVVVLDTVSTAALASYKFTGLAGLKVAGIAGAGSYFVGILEAATSEKPVQNTVKHVSIETGMHLLPKPLKTVVSDAIDLDESAPYLIFEDTVKSIIKNELNSDVNTVENNKENSNEK